MSRRKRGHAGDTPEKGISIFRALALRAMKYHFIRPDWRAMLPVQLVGSAYSRARSSTAPGHAYQSAKLSGVNGVIVAPYQFRNADKKNSRGSIGRGSG